jgi:hypothetical protein
VIVAQVNPLNPYQSTVIPFISVNETKLPANVVLDSKISQHSTNNISGSDINQLLSNMSNCQLQESRQLNQINALNQLLTQELNRRQNPNMMVQAQLLPDMMKHVHWNNTQNQIIPNLVSNRNLLIRNSLQTPHTISIMGNAQSVVSSYPQMGGNEGQLLGRRSRGEFVQGDPNCKIEYVEDLAEKDLRSFEQLTKRRLMGAPNYYPNISIGAHASLMDVQRINLGHLHVDHREDVKSAKLEQN